MDLIRRVAAALVVLGLVAAVGLLLYASGLKRKADWIARSSYELSLKTRRPTLADLRERFGNELKQSSPCASFGCGFEVVASNRVLAQMRIVDFSVLTSQFWVRDNFVDENVVSLFTGSRVAYADFKYCEGCQPFAISACEESMASIGSASVMVGSDSTLSEKRIAFGFNTACLTRSTACASVGEILPTAWRARPNGTLSCATGKDAAGSSQ